MARGIILMMDSFGIGASLDAHQFGDQGADTFGHIHEQAASAVKIPHLSRLGLYHAHLASTGKRLTGVDYHATPEAAFGYAVEQSHGKDTPSGHWELAGAPVLFEWGYFTAAQNCFPPELIAQFVAEANLPGILGNCHASGTDIIAKLGAEHLATGKPIIYTSADSVFQIAAHEEHFGLERLYRICQMARKLVDAYHIGRVIARPFVGQAGAFVRTANRKDYSVLPPTATLLDHMQQSGGEVVAIGKIADIFAHQGISREIKGADNMALFDATLTVMREQQDQQLIFTNFVDFDSLYGHRRDIQGYAKALNAFDARLAELTALLQADDLVFITADHGCDPSFAGSDHTREHIPVLAFGPKIKPVFLGRRSSFADIGQTLADWLHLAPLTYGCSFKSELSSVAQEK